MFDEVLQGALDGIEGARCVLLAGSDGMVVAAAVAKEGPAPEVLAASLADLFRRVAEAHRDAGLVPPKAGRDPAVSAHGGFRRRGEPRPHAIRAAQGRRGAPTRIGLIPSATPPRGPGGGCASAAPGGSLRRF